MRLTTKGRFAVTAIIDLAMQGGCGERPVQLREISLRQGISPSYLEQIFMRLKRSDVVRSVRGPGGGYMLKRKPEQLSIAALVDCAGERREMLLCGGAENCSHDSKCLTHDFWKGLGEHIDEYLSRTTLADLMRSAEVASVARRQQEEYRRLGGARMRMAVESE